MATSDGSVVLSKEQVNRIADFKVNCDIQTKDIQTYRIQLDTCRKMRGCDMSFYQEPWFIVGGITVAVGVGAMLGLLVSK